MPTEFMLVPDSGVRLAEPSKSPPTIEWIWRGGAGALWRVGSPACFGWMVLLVSGHRWHKWY